MDKNDAIIFHFGSLPFTLKQCFYVRKGGVMYDKIDCTFETLPLKMLQYAKEHQISNFLISGNNFYAIKLKEDLLTENKNKFSISDIKITIEEIKG